VVDVLRARIVATEEQYELLLEMIDEFKYTDKTFENFFLVVAIHCR